MKNLIYLKFSWTILVIGIAVYYFISQWDIIYKILQTFEIKTILLSIFLIVLSKLFIVFNQRIAQQGNSRELTYFEHFNIYNFTQLAKYIPGFVWQFIGKAGEYAQMGLNHKEIKSALATEVFFIIAGSGFTGLFFLILYESIFKNNLAVMFSFAVLISGFYFLRKQIRYSFIQKLTPKFFLIHIIIWCFLGGSFYILLLQDPFLWSGETFFKVVSVNALSFLSGYLAFFAPGGIGIREGMLAFMLKGEIVPDIMTLAAMHRFLIIVVEIGLFGISLMQKNYFKNQ